KLTDETLPKFLEKLKEMTVDMNPNNITQNPNILTAIVKTLSNVANRSALLSIPINKESTE
ncbi:hypothetical protein XENOCAPTIV_009788, partial [Xenoophorus captivus]